MLRLLRPGLALGATLALAVVVSGCQHNVLVRSWPSGAVVTLDDSPSLDDENIRASTPDGAERAQPEDTSEPPPGRVVLGQTPLTWTEDIGPQKPRVLKLTLDDEVREVVVERETFNWPAVAAWSAGGAGACIGLTGLGWASWGIAVGASDGGFAPFFPGVMMPIGALLCAGGIGAGILYGRQGPSEIMVDFEGARVISLPPDGARWKGETPAQLDVVAFEKARAENGGQTNDGQDGESTPQPEVGRPEQPPGDEPPPPGGEGEERPPRGGSQAGGGSKAEGDEPPSAGPAPAASEPVGGNNDATTNGGGPSEGANEEEDKLSDGPFFRF